MTRSRRWLVPGVLVLVALALLAAGVAEWQMTSIAGHCPANARCAFRQHRHHPLRAKLLWAGAGLVAIISVEAALWQRRHAGGLF